MRSQELVLLLGKNESYLIKAGSDINTKSGIIRSKDLLKSKFGGKIKTHLGKEFLVAKPTILDLISKKFKRGAQVVLPKDIGMILAYTGIFPDSLVVDAGTGSGYMSIMIANFLPKGKVVTYEKDKRFSKIAKGNIKVSGLENVKLKEKDISKGISEKNVDIVTLDLQHPEKVVKHAYKSLKVGGWLVVYSPTIEEVIKVSKALRKYFSNIKTVENIVREWKTERTTRPHNVGLVHTGWLIFARKLTGS
ncbi:MAG: tRNA (adenine-N1)-methyltransferase [Candidatus Aenigmarchaeota archaeon]|nr:tRNA (adenine-N1)-methyltransferase [Candidatus Aenigmarchaeota archaeon]